MNHRQVKVWARKGVGLLLAFVLTPATWADPDPAVLLERIHRVIAQTSLDVSGMKPWHVKLDIDLKDDKGNPTEKGTVEEWWASPEEYKRAYNFPSYAGTMAMKDGERYISDGVGEPPYMADFLLQQVIHPMPRIDQVDRARLDLRKETFGKSDFDCVMLDQPIVRVAYPPFGLFPTYCFDRDKDILRISSEFGSQLVVMNRKGTFRGIEVALDFVVDAAGKEAARAHLEALQGKEEAYAESLDLSGLKVTHETTVKVGTTTMEGHILNKVAPEYPDAAKRRQASGSVVMRAIIGKDGRVHFLQPKSFPDPDLVIAALAAARHWTYKPYLLNGVPTEVDTTITVNFKLRP